MLLAICYVVLSFFIIEIKNHNNMEEQYLTAKEAAIFMRISMPTLYRLTAEKAIPFYKPVKKLYFKKSELIEYINKEKKG